MLAIQKWAVEVTRRPVNSGNFTAPSVARTLLAHPEIHSRLQTTKQGAFNVAKLIPRKLLSIANTGTLICVGIAETACNLPLPPSGPRIRPGTGGAPGLEIPEETETSSGGSVASSTGGAPGDVSSGGNVTPGGSAGDGSGF